MTTETTIAPVRKSVVVKASVEDAFRIFTDGFDTWWPREHHIGSSPLRRAFIEGRVGGRCSSDQEDGTDCPWGTVTVWEPPHRFVFAWQITPQWKYRRMSRLRAKWKSASRPRRVARRASISSTGISSAMARAEAQCVRASTPAKVGARCCSCMRRKQNARPVNAPESRGGLL